jgi:hypothetical protein
MESMTIRQRWKQTALHNKLLVIFAGLSVVAATIVPILSKVFEESSPPQHSERQLSPNITNNRGNITIQGDIGRQLSQNLIDAHCESKILTTTPLASGETIKVLQLWPTPIANGGGGLMEMFVTKGSEFVWPKPKPEAGFPILNGYECKITNYTDGPVFNLWIELQEEFRECIRDSKSPDTMHVGQITLMLAWPINVTKIDAGIGNAFVFYVFNNSDNVAILSIPESVTVTMLDNTVQKIRLVHSAGSMQLWPQLNLPPFPKP